MKELMGLLVLTDHWPCECMLLHLSRLTLFHTLDYPVRQRCSLVQGRIRRKGTIVHVVEVGDQIIRRQNPIDLE